MPSLDPLAEAHRRVRDLLAARGYTFLRLRPPPWQEIPEEPGVYALLHDGYESPHVIGVFVAAASGLWTAIRRSCVAPRTTLSTLPDGVAFAVLPPHESESADHHQLRLIREQATIVEAIRLL